MNELALVQKVWNYAHVLRDQGVPYQAYISQISYLLFLKMDDERAGLVASGLIRGEGSAIPEDCRWPVLRDLQGEELTRRYSAILDQLSRHSGIVGTTFLKAQNEIRDPAKLRRLVGLIDGETWLGLGVDVKGSIYEGLLMYHVVVPRDDWESGYRRPGLKVLFTSGYTENAIIHHGRLDTGVLLLAKPYRKSDMAVMIRKAIAG